MAASFVTAQVRYVEDITNSQRVERELALFKVSEPQSQDGSFLCVCLCMQCYIVAFWQAESPLAVMSCLCFCRSARRRGPPELRWFSWPICFAPASWTCQVKNS